MVQQVWCPTLPRGPIGTPFQFNHSYEVHTRVYTVHHFHLIFTARKCRKNICMDVGTVLSVLHCILNRLSYTPAVCCAARASFSQEASHAIRLTGARDRMLHNNGRDSHKWADATVLQSYRLLSRAFCWLRTPQDKRAERKDMRSSRRPSLSSIQPTNKRTTASIMV